MRWITALAGAGLCALLCGTAARAQIIGVTADRTIYGVYGEIFDGQNSTPFSLDNMTASEGSVQYNLGGPPTTPFIYSRANYQIATAIDYAAGHIAFAANATSAGRISHVTVGTAIRVDYTNNTDSATNVTFNSTIIPAGFGAYVSNPAGNFEGGDINHNPESNVTFLGAIGDRSPIDTRPAYSRVHFQILSDHTTVAQYDATLSLFARSDGTYYTGIDPELDASGWISDGKGGTTPLVLNNFGLIAADDDQKAIGYRWDATDISVPLGELAAHDRNSLTYVTLVETVSQMNSNGTPNAQILSYAGFGDPVGQNGGAGGIGDPYFPLLNLSLPSFDSDTGSLSGGNFQNYAPAPLPLQQINKAGSAAVPESATWAMMLAGFGLIGVATRRRVRRSSAAWHGDAAV